MSRRDPVRAALAATLSAVLASRDEARRERDAAVRQARRDRAELEQMRRQLAECSVAHPARTLSTAREN